MTRGEAKVHAKTVCMYRRVECDYKWLGKEGMSTSSALYRSGETLAGNDADSPVLAEGSFFKEQKESGIEKLFLHEWKIMNWHGIPYPVVSPSFVLDTNE